MFNNKTFLILLRELKLIYQLRFLPQLPSHKNVKLTSFLQILQLTKILLKHLTSFNRLPWIITNYPTHLHSEHFDHGFSYLRMCSRHCFLILSNLTFFGTISTISLSTIFCSQFAIQIIIADNIRCILH